MLTPLSAQIIASKFQKLSRIPLKKLFQNLKTPLKKDVLLEFETKAILFPWSDLDGTGTILVDIPFWIAS